MENVRGVLVLGLVLMTFSSLRGQVDSTFTGYYEDFNDSVDIQFWDPSLAFHDNGRPAFIVTREDSALKIEMAQTVFSDGQMYEFPDRTLDLTDYPRGSVRIKVEPGVRINGMEVEELSVNLTPYARIDSVLQIQHDAFRIILPADNTWRDIYFDWGPDDDRANDFSALSAFNLSTVSWPETYEAVFWIDDFRLGDQVRYVPIDSLIINIEGGSFQIDGIGQNVQLSAATVPENAMNTEVRWSSNRAHVATIDQDGLLTTHAEGIVWITAMSVFQPLLKARSMITVTNTSGITEF